MRLIPLSISTIFSSSHTTTLYSLAYTFSWILFFWYEHILNCKCSLLQKNRSIPTTVFKLWGEKGKVCESRNLLFTTVLPVPSKCLTKTDSSISVFMAKESPHRLLTNCKWQNVPLQWENLQVTTLINFYHHYHWDNRTSLCISWPDTIWSAQSSGKHSCQNV